MGITKKTAFLIICSCCLAILSLFKKAAIAAPINLPASIITATDKKDPEIETPFYRRFRSSFAEKKSLNVRVGMDLTFSLLEKREVKSNLSGPPIHIEGQFSTFKLLLSLADRIELYCDIGEIDNMKFIIDEPGLKTTVATKGTFLRGGGLTATLFSFGHGFRLFSDNKYRGTGKFKIDNVSYSPPLFPGATTTQTMADSQVKYEEWQSALGISKEIFFRKDTSKKLIIFFGGVYSEIKASAWSTVTGTSTWPDEVMDWIIDLDLGSLESKSNIGGFTGFTFVANDEGKHHISIDAQCRFIDELSYSLSMGYRF